MVMSALVTDIVYEIRWLPLYIASIIFLYYYIKRTIVVDKEVHFSLLKRTKKGVPELNIAESIEQNDFSNNGFGKDEFISGLRMSKNVDSVSKADVAYLIRDICALCSSGICNSLKLYRKYKEQIEDEWVAKTCPRQMNNMYQSLVVSLICAYDRQKALDSVVEVVTGLRDYFKNLQALPLEAKKAVGATEEEFLEWVIDSKGKLLETICKLSVHNKKFLLLLHIFDHFGVFEATDSCEVAIPNGSERDHEEADRENQHVEKSSVFSCGLVKRCGARNQNIWSCLFYSSVEGANQLNTATGKKSSSGFEVVPKSTCVRQSIRLFCKIPKPSRLDCTHLLRLLESHLQNSPKGTEFSSVYFAVVELFERLSSRGSSLSPSQFREWFRGRDNLLICSLILSICAKHGTSNALQTAVQILEKIMEMREKITDVEEEKEMMPDAVMYYKVIKGILLNMRKEGSSEPSPLEQWALKHFADLAPYSQPYILSAFVVMEYMCHKFFKNGEVAKIDEYCPNPLTVLKNLISSIGENSKFSIPSRIASTLIRYYTGWRGFYTANGEEALQLDSAIEVYFLWMNSRTVFSGDLDVSCHKLLIMFCCRHGHTQVGYEILRRVAKIQDISVDEFHCNYVLNGLLKEKPLDIVEKTEAVVTEIMLLRRIPVSSTTLSILISIKVSIQDLHGALHILKHRAKNEFKAVDIQLRLYMQFATAAACSRQGRMAFEAYSLMRDEYDSTHSPSSKTYKIDVFSMEASNALLRKLYNNGCVKDCTRLAHYMEIKKIPHNKICLPASGKLRR